MAKSFKKAESVKSVYSGMWTQTSEQAQTAQEAQKTPKKSNKKAHEAEQAHKREKTPEKSIKKAPDVLEAPENRGRGRPRLEEAERKRHFNLLLKPATIEALTRAVGRIQAETGRKVTVTGLVSGLIDDYLAAQDR